MLRNSSWIVLCVTNSCLCSAETHGPQCASKYDDCEGGSKARCVHGICEDLVRVKPGEVGPFQGGPLGDDGGGWLLVPRSL